MSFGAGVGDFIQLTKLVHNTAHSIKHAPAHFAEAAQTCSSLDLLLTSIRAEVQKQESIFQRDPVLGERFAILTRACIPPLDHLTDILERHASLGTTNVKVLDRVRFSRKEVLSVQSQLHLRYANLSAFLETLGIAGMGRIEDKVDGLMQQQHRMILAIDNFANMRVETGSTISMYSNDDKQVWRDLRRDLNRAGFKSSDIERHKEVIYQKLVQLQQSGMLELDPQADFDDTRSEASILLVGRPKSAYQPPSAETVYEGSDGEDNCTTQRFRPDNIGPLFEDSDEDGVLDRPGVQKERNNAANERLPTYTDAVPSPRLNIPIPIPQRRPQSGGNSPRAALSHSMPNVPQFLGTSPRTNSNTFLRSPAQYDSSPRRSPETLPARPTSTGPRNLTPDQGMRTGKRSPISITWRYRRNGDIQRPPMQSADLGDGTLPAAASQGLTADVQRLLLQGHNIESIGSRAVPETASFEHTTSLYRAVRNHHFDTAHLLLRHGANPNPTRRDGKTLLRLLASEGELELLRLLLEYGAPHHAQGALPQAAFLNRLPVVALLLAHGADINEVSKHPALYRAASAGHVDATALLLREGAETSYLAPNGSSALYNAVANNHHDIAALLLSYAHPPDHGTGLNAETPLATACAMGQEPMVRLLLSHGARPDGASKRRDSGLAQPQRETPLTAAARGGRLSIARLLLDNHADPTLPNGEGFTALEIARERGDARMVEVLGGAPSMGQQLEKKTSRGERSRESLQVPGEKRRTRSASVRGRGKGSSNGAKLGATAAGMLLIDSLMLLGG